MDCADVLIRNTGPRGDARTLAVGPYRVEPQRSVEPESSIHKAVNSSRPFSYHAARGRDPAGSTRNGGAV